MLAFVHIPKTAGTTLHKILTHQYRKILIHHDSDGISQEDLASRVAADTPDLIIGHFSIGLHRWIPGLRYITCLRDPVARIASHYRHALADSSHYLHKPVTQGRMTLADYAASGLSGELSDGMTRMLAGMGNFHNDAVTPDILTAAISNLENLFDAVILSERFDEGVLLLAKDRGWKQPYYIRRKVAKKPGGNLSPEPSAVQVIEEHNRHDRQLYDLCLARFSKRAARDPGLQSQVEQFRRKNTHLGKAVFIGREIRNRFVGTER